MTATTIKRFILSIGLLAGTVIGAGVFSLPYVFKATGLLPGLVYIVIAVVIYGLIYTMYAEIISRTPGEHRFVGYARIYLGRLAGVAAIFSSVIQTIVVLAIYLILSESFLRLIIPIGTDIQKAVTFWLLGSAAIFLGVRKIALLETLITGGIVAIILATSAFGLFHMPNTILPAMLIGDWRVWLLPLAPVFFSLSGRQAIPLLVKINSDIKKPIYMGLALIGAIYIIFTLSVLALSPVVYPDAISGLIGGIPAWLLGAVGVLGALSLVSSYITVGFDVYKSLALDLAFPAWLRVLLIVFAPLALVLAGITNFIVLVSFAGGIFIALEGILIVLMWLRMTKKRISWQAILPLLVFTTALVYEIIK